MTLDTRQFLLELFGGKPVETAIVIWSLPRKATDKCLSVDQAVAAVEKRMAGDVYFGVALHDPGQIKSGSRGSIATSAGIVGLWLDIDIAGPNHKGANYPADEAAALALLGEMPKPPTLIVRSGGGLQPWWLFDAPWMFSDEQEKNRAAQLEEAWNTRAQELGAVRGWKLDTVKDLARVLRVPGTFNRKGGGEVPVTCEMNGPRYRPDELRIEPGLIAAPHPRAAITSVNGDWKSHISRNTRDFIAFGANEGERNMRFFSAACDLLGCGASINDIRLHLVPVAQRCGLPQAEIDAAIDSAAARPRSPSIPEDSDEIGTAYQHGREADDCSDDAGPADEATENAPLEAGREEPAPGERSLIGNIVDGTMEVGGEKKSVRYYAPADRIMAGIFEATGGWPCGSGGQLFVYREPRDRLPEPRDIRFLNRSSKFFAFLHERCKIRWDGKVCHEPRTRTLLNPVSKEEIFEYAVLHPKREYLGIELMPHEPEIPDLWYAPIDLPTPPPPEEADKSPLGKLFEALNPETPADRALMMAAMLTPGWGGEPGSRPAFVFASDYGRGTGKTTTAEVIASIWGGTVQIKPNEDRERVTQRLLSESAASTRIVLIDNLKGKLADGDIESLITVATIDGHRLFVGNTRRVNTLTWFITSNTPQLSKDLADRSVVVKVGRQNHASGFRSWAMSFIRENRRMILAQLLDLLRQPAKGSIPKQFCDRWQSWQQGVLCKFKNAAELAELVIARRADVDNDLDQAHEIASSIVRNLSDSYPDYLHRVIFFSRKQLHAWLEEDGIIDGHMHPRAVTSMVKGHLASGPLECLKYEQLKVDGTPDRYWVWYGLDAEQGTEKTRLREVMA